MNTTEQKKCTSCGEVKSLDCFSKASKHKSGLRYRCKQCDSAYEKLYKNKMSGRGIKDINLLTPDQIEYRSRKSTSKRMLYRINHARTLLGKAKYRAKMKNMEFTLTLEDLVIPETCPILNIPLGVSEKMPGANSASIDRLDSKKGYTKDNINVISNRANSIKSDATFEEFEAIYKWWKLQRRKKKKNG